MPPLPVFNGHSGAVSTENNPVTGDRSGKARPALCHERVINLYETRKKRWFSLLFSCLLAFSLITPAWAAEGERTLIPLGKAVGIKLFADGALVVSLEGSDTLYESLVIMGGGVIGVEFATFYANLGCRVTLIEGMDRLLPTMDRELGQNLGQILKKQGVEVLTSAMVQSVEQAPQGLTVHIDQKGKEKAVSGEKVLCAIGRRPCWDGLFAPDLTPETRGRSLRVDEDFQTSIPGVYAIGDVSAVIQLAHVAAAQGIACVDRLCGAASATDLNVVPSCIYSSPEIAVVGLTEAEAKEQGINAVSGKCTMFGNARTVIEDPGRCFMKLVADRDTGRLIGAQLMCQHASDIISQLSAALVNGLTVRQLLSVMRPHPSFEEAMTEALERLAEKL